MTGASTSANAGSARRASRAAALVHALGWPVRLLGAGWGLVVNPILLKELKVSSRRKRTYFLRAGYLLLLVTALLLTWWAVIQGSMTQSTAEVLQRQSQTGEALSLTLGWIQLVVLILVAPMLTGSCVSDEIEDRSLDVLLITPLSAAQIIVGKMLSRFVYIGLLVLLSAPLLLAMRTYGGFTLDQLIRLEALSLSTALLGASVAILLSCWEARGWRAVAMTYFWLALWWFAIPLIAVASVFLVVGIVKQFMPWLPTDAWVFDWEAYPFLMMHINPVVAMVLLTYETSMGSIVPWPTQYAFMTINAINIGSSAVLLLLAVPLLRRTANKRMAAAEQHAVNWIVRLFRWRGVSAPPIAVPAAAGESAEAAPNPVVVASAAGSAATGNELAVPKVWDNAILWREMRFTILRRPITVAVVSLLILALLAWYNIEAEVRSEVDMLVPLIFLAMIAQLVVACVVSPTVIASEQQARSWEVLLCVPLKPITILWTKALGSLKIAMIPLVVLMLELLYYSSRHSVLLLLALQLAVVSIAFSILLACTGAVLSLWFKRSMTAMATNLGLAIMLWGGLPAGIGLITALRGWNSRVDDMIGVSLLINPFYWFGVMSEYLGSSGWRGAPVYDLQFWNTELNPAEFTWLVLFVGTVVSAAGFGLLYAASTWFNHWTGRSS